jgi:CRP-like cAMP-binding protein
LYKRVQKRIILPTTHFTVEGFPEMAQEQDAHGSVENLILASLPAEERARLLSQMERVELPRGLVVIEPEEAIPYAYFPAGALISLVSMTEEGRAVEVGTIGREGMAGLPIVLGGGTTPMRSVVQIEGGAYRLRAGLARREFDAGGALQKALHRYMHALFVASSQSAACNALHRLEGRLCRWLLVASDGVGSESLPLTHEYLAIMLGVRRAGVTEACGLLRDEGLIDYTRGMIRLTDREGLEDMACECYQVQRKEFDRMLGRDSI